jgi:L-2-hydroxyglutarate oxidase LhgO
VSAPTVAIIGAGVVGLACARAATKLGWDVIVLEKEDGIGRETSSRNSEVLHAGIYYPAGSLKATLCVHGLEQIYSYCKSKGVPHSQVGKLIVAASDDEIPQLQKILERAHANGARDVRLVDVNEMRELEPAVRGVKALYSPKSGIIDSHSYMRALFVETTDSAATFSFRTRVEGVSFSGSMYKIMVAGGELEAEAVINTAGLYADAIASMLGLNTQQLGYKQRYVKGTYFRYNGISPVKRLIYPVPQAHLAGLGIHGTLDMAGHLKFGPDVEPIESINYDVDSSKRDAFFESASKIISGLDRERFAPDQSGIRPKLVGEGIRDFVINEESENGLPGFVNLLGIESPGLTASLAIADRVTELLQRKFS